MTWNGATLSLYVNGLLEGQSSPGPQQLFTNNAPIGIGRHSFWGTRAYDGWIDEPAYYDHALTPQEIRALHDAGSLGKCPAEIPFNATIVELRSSSGASIANSGATIEYQPNASGPYLMFGDGSLDPEGREWSVIADGIHRYRLTYQDMTRTLLWDNRVSRVILFSTTNVLVRLRGSAEQVLPDSTTATVEWQSGASGDYLPFGDHALNAQGEASMEVLPGTHRFRLNYQATQGTRLEDVSLIPLVTFSTTNVLVRLRGSAEQVLPDSTTATVDWQSGASGDYLPFGDHVLNAQGEASMEVLPGTHRFRLNYQTTQGTRLEDVSLNPFVTFSTTNVLVRLRGSAEQILPDSTTATVDWQSGASGDYLPFGDHALNAQGEASMEVLPGTHRFRLNYQETQGTRLEDVSLNPLVTFSTTNVLVRLRGSAGQVLPDTTTATVDWQSGASGSYLPFGDHALNAQGEASMEVLPGTHRFRLDYQDATWPLLHDLTTGNIVSFTTALSTLSLVDSLDQPIPGAVATLEWQSESSGSYAPYDTGTLDASGTSSMEVVPDLHRFRIVYQGVSLTQQKSTPTEPDVVFKTVRVTVEIRDPQSNLILNSNAPVTWQPGSTGAYQPFGADGFMNPDGTEAQEILAKTHRFRVTYGGVTKTVSTAISGNATVVLTFP